MNKKYKIIISKVMIVERKRANPQSRAILLGTILGLLAGLIFQLLLWRWYWGITRIFTIGIITIIASFIYNYRVERIN